MKQMFSLVLEQFHPRKTPLNVNPTPNPNSKLGQLSSGAISQAKPQAQNESRDFYISNHAHYLLRLIHVLERFLLIACERKLD